MGLVARRVGGALAPRRSAPPPRLTLRTAARAWGAALAAVCGGGLVVGIPSGLVPDVLEPPVGVALLAVAAREVFRVWRAGVR